MSFVFKIRLRVLKKLCVNNCTFVLYFEHCNRTIHNYGLKTERPEFIPILRRQIESYNDLIFFTHSLRLYYVDLEVTNILRRHFDRNNDIKILFKIEYVDEYGEIREAGPRETRQLVYMTAGDDEEVEALFMVYTSSDREHILRKRRSAAILPETVTVERTVSEVYNSTCSLRPWMINTDLYYTYTIIAPKKLEINFCYGSCQLLRINTKLITTENAMVRSKFLNVFQRGATTSDDVPAPRCSPKDYIETFVLFKHVSNFVIESVPDLVVVSCYCA